MFYADALPIEITLQVFRASYLHFGRDFLNDFKKINKNFQIFKSQQALCQKSYWYPPVAKIANFE